MYLVTTELNLILEYIVNSKLLLILPFFLPVSEEYMNNVNKFYLASVESADFVNAAEESRKIINSWAGSQTNGTVGEGRP